MIVENKSRLCAPLAWLKDGKRLKTALPVCLIHRMNTTPLADDLYDIGYVKASERTIINWRNRTYKHVSYEAVLAVKLAHERRQLDRDIKDAKIQEIISDL